MDAPPIQCARSEAGASLAYLTLGERSSRALITVSRALDT